jgi:hypothetical protein
MTLELDEELLERALAAAGTEATKTAVIEQGLKLVREKLEAERLEQKRTRLALKALNETDRKGEWISETEMDRFFDAWEQDPIDPER